MKCLGATPIHIVSLLLVWSCALSPGAVRAEDQIDRECRMRSDPGFVIPEVEYFFSPELKPLWVRALGRPESELKRLAADAIANATRRGMEGLDDTTPELVSIIASDRESPAVQQAAVRALIALDARKASKDLANCAARGNMQLALLIEPVLAEWDYQPLRDLWVKRLAEPDSANVSLRLAIEGVGRVRAPSALEPLLQLVEDRNRQSSTRMAAARAVGRIAASALVERARKLASGEGSREFLGRLLAGAILLSHEDEEAIALLSTLAADERPTVAAQAFGRLLEVDPKLVFELGESAILRPDARMRRLGSRALVARGDVASIRLLGPLLNDENPSNRRYVAARFAEFATKDALKDSVIEQAMAVLGGEDWRGLEQALLLLGYLDYEPAADRCLELLDHDRPEAYITAAWALRHLQVPETLPGMLAKGERLFQWFKGDAEKTETSFFGKGHQCAELFQAFGVMRYREADSLLRRCVPKQLDLDPELRAAACWALGYVCEGNPDPELVKQMRARVEDINSLVPEDPAVIWMCAIALGRMQAKAGIPSLRSTGDYFGPNYEPGRACYWAIEQITGEPSPPPVQEEAGVLGWFLDPVGN